jgi:amidase
MPLPLPEYDDLDATAMAAAVRGGQLSPRELLDAAIARVEARDPALNAVVERHFDRARARVDALPDGPLKGVPFLLKDLKIQLEGTVTTNSCALKVGKVATASSELTRRYEAAGLQILGKTNTPEFGIMGVTEPALRGPCRNPWNLDHTPGGSSGGSASAVAARLVPVAHGGDGGGSIRIPASACGLFGLKPTRGRITMAPALGEAWMGMVQEHVLTRTVRDSALLLDLTDGPTPGEPYAAPAKARPWVDEVGADPGRLTIAVCREALYATHQDPACVAAVDAAARLLEDLGHTVVEARPQLDVEALVRAYFVTVAAGTAVYAEDVARDAGLRPSPRHFEPGTWLLALIGWRSPASALERASREMDKAARVMGAFHQKYDLLLTSTLARPPARVGQLTLSTSEELQIALLRNIAYGRILDFAIDQMGRGKLAYTPNTQLFNQTGQPAVSLPLHTGPDGLPIGVQLGAALGREDLLLRVSAQLEQAAPWADRRPATLRR